MKTYLVILIVFAMLFESCKKDKPTENTDPTVYLSPILSDYIFFDAGTYWVYKDAISGAFDTLTVINKKSKNLIYTGDDTPYEYRQIELKSSFSPELPITIYSDAHHPVPYYELVWWNRGGKVLSPFDSENNIIFSSAIPSKINSELYVEKGKPTMVNGIIYNNTVLVIDSMAKVTSLVAPFDYEVESKLVKLIYEKGVGLVKKEISGKNPQLWELIDYKIVR